MILLEPQETPYDLRFKLFNIPVRVHPMFWLICALLSWQGIHKGGLELVLVWMACIFISILIHELGHVWMGMYFGTRGYIVLYGFGGLAIGSNAQGLWWKRVLVSLAGPVAGFLFLAAILAGVYLADPGYMLSYLRGVAHIFRIPTDQTPIIVQQTWPPLLEDAIWGLVSINLFWGLLNLLPIFPLDGGQISRDVLSRYLPPGRGMRISLGISFVVAALFAVNSLFAVNDGQGLIPYLPTGGVWMAILFGLLAMQSFMTLQQLSSSSYHDPYDPWGGQGRPWER